ncbi:MAG: polysaccharide deacetylase family protein [Peptococcaceae bacterium]|nr:polysaccharide deacetylase family protein [Peptococcaceae bacterium]
MKTSVMGKMQTFLKEKLTLRNSIVVLAIVLVVIVLALINSQDSANVTVAVVKPMDVSPPEILGLTDKVLSVGETCDFSYGVTVVDDTDENPVWEIDDAQVDFALPGVYEVVYRAWDHWGNMAERTITVTIKPRPDTAAEKILYLTFDDGPSARTLELLEILDRYQVKATFFVTGLYNRDDILKVLVDRGHAIGLHTNTHNYAEIYAGEEAFFADLSAIEKRVVDAVGFRPVIMRFAGGSSNGVSKKYNEGIMSRLSVQVHERGYKYYDWTTSVADTAINVTVESEIEVARNCTANVIYLLAHDDKEVTIEAMKTMIPMLIEKGYQFRTIEADTPEYHHPITN